VLQPVNILDVRSSLETVSDLSNVFKIFFLQ
jgi:hypothetical protein